MSPAAFSNGKLDWISVQMCSDVVITNKLIYVKQFGVSIRVEIAISKEKWKKTQNTEWYFEKILY
jgi:hypothetical protein